MGSSGSLAAGPPRGHEQSDANQLPPAGTGRMSCETHPSTRHRSEIPMSGAMKSIVEAIENQASGDAFLSLPVPKTFHAVTTHKDEQKLFDGIPSAEKDPR